MTGNIGCSIIVCCYNGAERLRDTLSHISRQKLHRDQVLEVLLVDNASTDSTVEVALQAWHELNSPVSFRIICEKQPGVSYARRAGVLAAKYEIIIFCDDDNWLSKDYVAYSIEIMRAYPKIGIAGGRHLPVFEGMATPPDWFYTYCADYAVGVQALQTGDISARGYIWGAGMVLRAPLLRLMYIKGVDPLLSGRSGLKLLSGDDSEICKWYLMAGYQLWYDDRLCLSHFIPGHRQSKEYLVGLHEGFRAAQPVLIAYDALLNRRRALFNRRPLAWIVSQLVFWKRTRNFYRNLARIESIVVNSFRLIN